MIVRYVPQAWNDRHGLWEPLTSGFLDVKSADLWLQAWKRDNRVHAGAPHVRTRVAGISDSGRCGT